MNCLSRVNSSICKSYHRFILTQSKHFTSESVKLLGWPNSPFTAKVRGYLHHKKIPFEDVTVSAFGAHFKIKNKTGRYMIPVVYHSHLGVLQDSHEIINTLEMHCDDAGTSVVPGTAKQRFVSNLLECFADGWLISTAMHTRWNTTEKNRLHMKAEFGKFGLPWFPKFIQRKAGAISGDSMKAYLSIMGISKETSPGFDDFIIYWLKALEDHLSTSDFLFGGRPSIADFAVMGPLYAHIFRDKFTGWKEIVEKHTNVTNWLHRTHSSQHDPTSSTLLEDVDWFPNDEIPETLVPLMKPVVEDYLPYVSQCVKFINNYCLENKNAKRVPRALGWTDFTVFGYHGKRRILTFEQWKIQNVLSVIEQSTENEKVQIFDFLNKIGAPRTLLDIDIQNPLVRHNYKEVLKK